MGSPSTVTTSAAVRLTDKARAKDVTALLRGKFGLPSIISSSNDKRNTPPVKSTMSTRLSEIQKDGNNRYRHQTGANNTTNNTLETSEDEIDALVIVGTIVAPPKGYIRFEQEEPLEEQQRLELFRHYNSQHMPDHERGVGQLEQSMPRVRENSEDTMMKMATKMAHLPVSESAATVQASGGGQQWVSSMLLAPSASSGTALSLTESDTPDLAQLGGAANPSTHLGLDLSSSRGGLAWGGKGGGNRTTPWGSLRGETMDFSSSRGKALSSSEGTLANQLSAVPHAPQPTAPSPCFEHDLEPIHIVRTVLPDEHPLLVRDDMMSLLNRLRQKAEEEMGLYLNEDRDGDLLRQHPRPTFRWYFQPCSPLGGIGSSSQSPKLQNIPAYIDLEGYCTEEESESDHEDSCDSDGDEEGKKENRSILSKEEKKQPKPVVSLQMRQLIKEKRRIAMLRDLPNPSFLVSGYLLKQSSRDPNVWRRVYCVLSEDRLWFIGRMKPLKKRSDTAPEVVLSCLRVGRHKHTKLHRSLLVERGDGGVQTSEQCSSSRYSGYRLMTLDHRLPHAFRIMNTSQEGNCHTFRAYNSQSFRVWVTSISERIAQKAGDAMMDLGNMIAEEETYARCRRMDDIAVSPLESPIKENTATTHVRMDIVRFGISVAAFRELCRHVNDAMCQYHGNVVNVQTRVGGGHGRMRQHSSPTAGQRSKNAEHAGMISSVWEDARIVASKSAQLLHALATMEHDQLNKQKEPATPDFMALDKQTRMEELIGEQKEVQAILGKHWDTDDDALQPALPSMHLFDSLLEKLQSALA